MIKVDIYKQSNYPLSSIEIRKRMQQFFTANGIVSDAYVSIAIVGEKKMRELGMKFMGESESDPLHNVLSFVPGEASQEFVYPQQDLVILGEIIVCYPVAFEEAKKEGINAMERVLFLLEHGGDHLLGKHHK